MKGQDFYKVCIECPDSCCRYAKPPISDRREKIIQDYIKNKNLRLNNPFTRNEYTYPREDADGYCIFYYKETKKCMVHNVKPETCVAGPITFDVNFERKEIELYLKISEICPLAGLMGLEKKIFKEHMNNAKKEIFRLIKELPLKELEAILQIEEPETFRICAFRILDDQILEISIK
jgi:Fe-S-cluster containining protein